MKKCEVRFTIEMQNTTGECTLFNFAFLNLKYITYHIHIRYKIKLQYFTITCIAWPQFEHFSVNTHSLSSSLMSSNTPRSTIPIWFSISCLFRDGTNDWDLRSGTGKELVLVDESEATAYIQLQNRALWALDRFRPNSREAAVYRYLLLLAIHY